jgi:hypothetical protein
MLAGLEAVLHKQWWDLHDTGGRRQAQDALVLWRKWLAHKLGPWVGVC